MNRPQKCIDVQYGMEVYVRLVGHIDERYGIEVYVRLVGQQSGL